MVTTIEIVDTAIKVGLGALISGLGAFWIAKVNYARELEKEKLNYERELEKERIRRRRDLLEAVALGVETFSHAVMKNWSSARYFAQSKQSGEEEQKRRLSNLAATVKNLFDAFKEESNAGAKLRLLGEQQCYSLLDEYVSDVKIFTADHVAGLDKPIKFLDEYKQTLRDKKAAFFNGLSSVYNRDRP